MDTLHIDANISSIYDYRHKKHKVKLFKKVKQKHKPEKGYISTRSSSEAYKQGKIILACIYTCNCLN